MTRPGLLRQVGAVFAKDLLIEWRGAGRLSALFFFALAVVVLVAFAVGIGGDLHRRLAPGVLWIGLLLASTRSLDQAFWVELEQGALEGLLLWPVEPMAVFYGKALANLAVLLLVVFALLPLTLVLYNAQILGSLPHLFGFLVLGSAAVAAPGTLYALLTSRARGASALLPVLLFPLVAPALMAAARGTAVVMEGDPMGEAGDWLQILALFNAVHWTVSGLLFGRLLEDT